MNKKLKKLIVLTGVLSLILMSCAVKNQSKANYNIQEGQRIKDTYYYDVEEDFKGMSLEIDLILEKGEVEFELIDPDGEIRWNEKVDSTKEFKEKKEFEKLVGEWDLRFENVDESGEGKLNLEFNRK